MLLTPGQTDLIYVSGRSFHRNGHYWLAIRVGLGLISQAFQTSRFCVAKQMTQDEKSLSVGQVQLTHFIKMRGKTKAQG